MSHIKEAQARAEPLLAPIPGDHRAGVDARNDPRAELLRDEMRKDEYLRRDWPAISAAAAGLLVAATKDIVVATCWASAAYETCGLSGLAAGLSLLQGLLGQYWEDMFPPPAMRIRRENALGNFYEHLGARLQAVKTDPKEDTGAAPLGVVTADDAPLLAACAALLESLHETAQTRFNPPPPPRVLRAQLARLQAALPKPAAVAAPDPLLPATRPVPLDVPAPSPPPVISHTPTASVSPAISQTSAAPVSPAISQLSTAPVSSTISRGSAPPATPLADAAAKPSIAPPAAEPLDPPQRPPPNPGDVPAYLNALAPNLARAAHALRRHQPGDPLAYRLLRVAVWLRAAEPAPDSHGRAAIDPLPPAVRTPCEAMLRSGKWPELLDTSECALATPAHRFCLDLHRYSLAALAALGHAAARAALLAELAALLHRMPGLLDLCARDGAPLADSDTRALLLDLSPAPRPGSSTPVPTTLSQVPPSLIIVPTHLSSPPDLPATSLLSHAPGPSDPPHPMPARSAPLAPSLAVPGLADTPLEVALTAARLRLAARDLPGALALVQRHADSAATPRDRFVARTALACFTLEAGLIPVARAQLTALLREADERRLADWEPHLIARLLDALLTAHRHTPSPDTAGLQNLFDHLSTLDPSAAARHAPRNS